MRALITVGMFVWLLVALVLAASASSASGSPGAVSGAASPYVAQSMLAVLINLMYFGGAWYFGDRTWAARQQRLVIEQRTAELEAARSLADDQAVALERVRIARELHDVVAHHVSLMGVQAGAARLQIASDPDAAGTTLTHIEGSARSALAELRQLLATLRTPEGEASPTPSPGLAGIANLAAEASDAGLPTRFDVVGEPVTVPEVVEVNLYRIAQEALTNARRHGGGGATADVRLRYVTRPASIEIEIANTGRPVRAVRAGLGHTGMRERAAASGGTIELAPRSGGGFVVRARVPLTEARDVDAEEESKR